MTSNLIKYYVSLCLLIILTSCKTETITNKPQTKINMTKDQLFKKIVEPTDLTHIKIKGTVEAEIDKPVPNVGIVMYIEKDKKIWINGSVFILNVFRADITPNKVRAYEKAQSTYIDTDFQYFNNLLNVNFINFTNLEKLLLGKVFFPIKDEDFQLTIEGNQYVLSSINDFTVTAGNTKATYSQKLWFDNQFNLSKVVVHDKISNSILEIQYSNRVTYKNLNLPKNVNILIKDKKPKAVSLEYTNFDSEKIETPYQVPSGYTKREIK